MDEDSSDEEEKKALVLNNSTSKYLTGTFIQGTPIINPPVKPNSWIDESRTTGREVSIAWNYSDTGTTNRATREPNDDTSASSSSEKGVAIPLQHTGLGQIPTRSEVFWEPNEGDSPRRTTENKMTIAVEPGNMYRIWIRGVNMDKPGPSSEKLLFRSAPLKPINLNVYERHDNSLKLDFVDPDRRPKRYRIVVRNESGEMKKNGVVSGQFYIVRDLKPGGRFQISVQAIDKNGKFGFESDEASVLFTLRPPAPENLTCNPEQDEYRLCWDKVEVATGYKVSWRCGSEKACSVPINSTILFLKQTELQTEKYYDIIVLAVDDQGNESKPAVTQLRTGPAKPSDVKVKPDGKYSIMVTFREVTSTPNSYKVVAKPVDGGKEVQNQTDIHSVKLDLEPGKDYEIYVHAKYKGQQSFPARYGELVHTCPAKVKRVEIKNEGNNMFKVKWERVNGEAEYHVTLNGKNLPKTNELEYILTDLDRTKNHVVEVRASNDVGKSAKCQAEILAAPTNIRISIESLDTVEIQCDECCGAKNYVFTINSESITKEIPMYKLSLENECIEFTVKVCANSENADGAESKKSFRHVVSIVQDHFKKIAASILPPERYVIPKVETVWPNDCADSSGSRTPRSEDFVTLQTKEFVLVQGGHFCGKTSLCAHFIQNNQSNNLVIYVDAHHYISDKTCDIKSFLSKIKLSEDEYERLLTWMKNNSQEVKFVVDNALTSCTTTSSSNHEEIFGDIFYKERIIFPNSSVLLTSSWNTQIQNQMYSRVIKIRGFSKNEFEQMRLKNFEHRELVIPEKLKYLCINPGFCSVILENVFAGQSDECHGKWLTEVILKLIDRIPEAEQNGKIESIQKDIASNGQKIDISPKVSIISEEISQPSDISNNQPDCEDLELEYGTVLYCTYFMKIKSFKNFFSSRKPICAKESKQTLDIRQHARKWAAIAGLLRKDLEREVPKAFQISSMGKSHHVHLKRKCLRKFMKRKKHKLKTLILRDPELARCWFTCIVELDAFDIFKKCKIKVNPKNSEERINVQDFMQTASVKITDRIQLPRNERAQAEINEACTAPQTSAGIPDVPDNTNSCGVTDVV